MKSSRHAVHTYSDTIFIDTFFSSVITASSHRRRFDITIEENMYEWLGRMFFIVLLRNGLDENECAKVWLRVTIIVDANRRQKTSLLTSIFRGPLSLDLSSCENLLVTDNLRFLSDPLSPG